MQLQQRLLSLRLSAAMCRCCGLWFQQLTSGALYKHQEFWVCKQTHWCSQQHQLLCWQYKQYDTNGRELPHVSMQQPSRAVTVLTSQHWGIVHIICCCCAACACRTSTHWSSTSRTCCRLQRHTSSTPCTTHTGGGASLSNSVGSCRSTSRCSCWLIDRLIDQPVQLPAAACAAAVFAVRVVVTVFHTSGQSQQITSSACHNCCT
jgi:hypothetical protein